MACLMLFRLANAEVRLIGIGANGRGGLQR
jgi:hypothetical protein